MRSHLPSLITELSYYTVRCLWLNSWSVSPWQEQTSSHHPKNDARHHCATLQQPRSSAPWTTAQWKHQARETIKVETPCHLEEANYLAVDFKEAKSNVNLKNPHLWRHQGNPLWSAQVPRYLPGNGPQICQFHPCQVVGVSKFKKNTTLPLQLYPEIMSSNSSNFGLSSTPKWLKKTVFADSRCQDSNDRSIKMDSDSIQF